nr:nucleoside hydrolase [Candidatus Sigynarchaeota archaeon]
MTKTPVILDTDIGSDIDDTWALGLLLKSPELDLKLVTTCTDDTPYRAKIVARMLEIAGKSDIPIGIGPRESEDLGPQGPWVIDYDLSRYPGKIHADGIDALIQTVMNSAGPVTIITIGPLTNIALALAKESRIASKARIVAMLGSIHVGYGENSTPAAEYNVARDASACQHVLAAPWDITLTPLDTCGNVILAGEHYKSILDSNDAIAQAIVENYETWNFARGYTTKPDETSVLFDTVAVYLAISEDLVNMAQLNIIVNKKGFMKIRGDGKACRCALSWKDFDRYKAWLVERLTS